ncbi:RsmB/NOP family class I SAM-dependent RNA methyltransferase [Psychromarinibacter sp. C21-152]|uniref:RsmB/NOP family class I SAM-dependent RNA methyltransferase n=1 Tax=Psychromarinibacter sediminicola TaxID=3033385 RepID=A0AAE3NR51_9RHOB|nr:RsmB/NOP family class I SAM-dependent RNA methyltransferase [Psychromarinibacter sediminicola]MDF0599430.1 RsmB/NOP family class I SAM-dependent RNA methyltransferase [Psychromarinibacter sediminicola]
MTPAARIAAAIEVLDAVLAGEAAEKVLTGWARGHRFAGSGDRAAIRDHVFDALRCRRSCAWVGGADTGRGLMLGAVRLAGGAPEEMFTGARFAPAPVGADEGGESLEDAPEAVRLDMPDWLMPPMAESLGDDCTPVLEALRRRAPVFLRVNAAKAEVAEARAALAEEGVSTRPHPLAETALEVTENPRRVQGTRAYREGLVELQDAASQAVCAALPAGPGTRVLDYCAGGGGKALALAARGAEVVAHDADPRRMRDLPERARRAGVRIETVATEALPSAGRFDLVLCDAPCSGSGAWRRSPEAKWRLTPARLRELQEIQMDILLRSCDLVAPGGTLAYATCSLLAAENDRTVAAFRAAAPAWRLVDQRRWTPRDGGDGFYLAQLMRDETDPP